MAPKFKVTYFKFKARAEPIRLLLAYGKQEFEDVFVDDDKWPQVKKSLPFGQIPTLEVDGKVIHQSVAIGRYLAKEFGLAGSSDEESLEIDMIVDTFEDWTAEMLKKMDVQGEEAKAAAKKSYMTENLPYYASRFEKLVTANGGYFVGGKLSLADVFFVTTVGFVNYILGVANVLEPYPNLKSLQKKVFEEPNIKAYLDKREPIPEYIPGH